jgi:hypothetical protein
MRHSRSQVLNAKPENVDREGEVVAQVQTLNPL